MKKSYEAPKATVCTLDAESCFLTASDEFYYENVYDPSGATEQYSQENEWSSSAWSKEAER